MVKPGKHNEAGGAFGLQGGSDTCTRKGWVGQASHCSSSKVLARPVGSPQQELPIRRVPHWWREWPGTRPPAVFCHWLSTRWGKCGLDTHVVDANGRTLELSSSHAPCSKFPCKSKRVPPWPPHEGQERRGIGADRQYRAQHPCWRFLPLSLPPTCPCETTCATKIRT